MQACHTWQDLHRFKRQVAKVARGLLCSCKLRLEMTTEEFSPVSDTMMPLMLMLHRCSTVHKQRYHQKQAHIEAYLDILQKLFPAAKTLYLAIA